MTKSRAEKTNNSLNILGFGESKSDGLDKGVVVNIKKTISSIKKSIEIFLQSQD